MAVTPLAESAGWVTGSTPGGPIAHHRSPNQEPGMAVPSGVLGVVMHTMVGNLPGTDTAFLNPSFQASAHFGISQAGQVIQWVSVRGGIAWHAAAANPHWYGIEHADNGDPGTPLTDAQLTASAQLVELLSRDDVGRFALQVTNRTDTEGYGVHNMGGGAWGGHTCPQLADGSGPRAGQRAEIIRRAAILRETGHYPAPTTAGPYRHTADGILTLADVAAGRHTTQAHLAETTLAAVNATHRPVVAAYLALDAANYAVCQRHVPMPEGMPFYTSNP